MDMNSWFEVDTKGLAALQKSKPKHYILRELIQNAWDEDITECKTSISIKQDKQIITASVYDDNPQGFRNIKDSFVLFGDTYKRKDPSKRGRFNLGEKQAISRCIFARIKTTKGTIIFDNKGREQKDSETLTKGSEIYVEFEGNKKDYDEILKTIENYLPPKNIKYFVNNKLIIYKKPIIIYNASLTTEIAKEDGILTKTVRTTSVNIHSTNEAYLYEMGIPITKIDCKYSIDIQQKIPLSVDRETVSPAFLQDVYAETLNNIVNDIKEEEAAQLWIRTACEDERIDPEVIKKVLENRYGPKFVVANPLDKQSIIEAVSNGYRVIFGSELSKGEWENIKEHNLMPSTSDLFSINPTKAESVEPDDNMKKTAAFAKEIAKRLLNVNINVEFKKYEGDVAAQYSGSSILGLFNNRTLTFNVTNLGVSFFNPPISTRTIDLIIHELGHENGSHTEKEYHQTLTSLAAKMIILALDEPAFFKN